MWETNITAKEGLSYFERLETLAWNHVMCIKCKVWMWVVSSRVIFNLLRIFIDLNWLINQLILPHGNELLQYSE